MPDVKTKPNPKSILADDGLVARRMLGYEPRPQQLEMAAAVAHAFSKKEHLIVEAGTGVGKSFAYLVPAIQHAISGGGRVVISTHTIALQEQLVDKDIPFLQSIFPEEFTAVLVKGRSNYLGIRRLTRTSARQQGLLSSRSSLADLHRIEQWAQQTRDGSLADLPFQPDSSLWELVKSDGDDCLGRKCPHFQKCFYQRARRRATTAQLLIVNHALLFSDLAVRERGASILPDYQFLVLDEAHTVERVAGDHLGLGVTNAQVRFLLNRLYNERAERGMLKGGPGESAIPLVSALHKTADRYFSALAYWRASKVNWNGRIKEPPPVEQNLSDGLSELSHRLREAANRISEENDKLEYESMTERSSALAKAIDSWHQLKHSDWVHWLEVVDSPRQRVTIAAQPVDVGPILKETMFDKLKCAVLTSATLTTAGDEPFAYIRGRLGLDTGRSLLLGSPFDFRRQLTVHVEAGLPDPGNALAFVPAACRAIEKYVQMSDGRAFVLFTSYRMLEDCAELMRATLQQHGMPLFVQGDGMPRSKMLHAFRTTPRSVLFGTETFWTGVDVPGDALSNVIIVKLPFAAPNEPMTEARIDRIRQRGGNPFMEYQVPEAVLKFRQGIGRLIRTKTDTGIIVLLDPRVLGKSYGRRFLDALPECDVTINK
jgi:ATP-dependent DNA helicase DinG